MSTVPVCSKKRRRLISAETLWLASINFIVVFLQELSPTRQQQKLAEDVKQFMNISLSPIVLGFWIVKTNFIFSNAQAPAHIPPRSVCMAL